MYTPTFTDRYLDIQSLRLYADVSKGTILEWLHDPTNPLPHYRLKDEGKILVKQSEFDEWFRQFRRIGTATAARIQQTITVNGLAG
jgi:hypothetical protein